MCRHQKSEKKRNLCVCVALKQSAYETYEVVVKWICMRVLIYTIYKHYIIYLNLYLNKYHDKNGNNIYYLTCLYFIKNTFYVCKESMRIQFWFPPREWPFIFKERNFLLPYMKFLNDMNIKKFENLCWIWNLIFVFRLVEQSAWVI